MNGRRMTLSDFEDVDDVEPVGLDELTDAQREVYEIVVVDKEMGPRELARKTNRSPGTISNHLRRARNKIDEREES